MRRALIGSLLAAIAAPLLPYRRAGAQALTAWRDPPDLEVAWVCPMHPFYTAAAAGTCPLCGMVLIRTRPYDTRDYQLQFRTEPAQVRPGQRVTLLFTFLRPGTREVVKDFEIVHTKPFHLFVISQDMTFFEHIHPRMGDDGTWSIETTLPMPGSYQVLCDFMPAGGSGQFLAAALITAGYEADLEADRAHLVADREPTKADGDLSVHASFDPPQPVSGQYVHLNFFLTDSGTGRPVTDLQTYLGQFSHMLLMSEDLECYVHSHPINIIAPSEDTQTAPEYIIAPDADLEAIRGGPQVIFDALMPKPGMFRAWAQFRRNDQVRTVAFTFRVAPGAAEPSLS